MRKLGASVLGSDCHRKLFLLSVGMKEEFTELGRRRMEVGSELEKVVVDWLRRDNNEVWYGESDREADFRIQVEGGVISGKIDIMFVQEDGVGRVADIKVVGLDRYYDILKVDEKALQSLIWDYVVQCNLYVYGLLGVDVEKLTGGMVKRIDSERWELVVASRELCRYVRKVFQYNEDIVNEVLGIVREVFSVRSIEDFRQLKIDEALCRWCSFSVFCKAVDCGVIDDSIPQVRKVFDREL